VLACPAHRATHLLGWAPEIASDLAALEYASCATVNLVYPASTFSSPPESFGFFVGAREGLPILACSHVSVKFPDRVAAGQVLLRVFLGGARAPQAIDGDDETIGRRAHETLVPLLGLGAEPTLARVQRFPQSMPQFHVGYRRRVDGLAQRLESLSGLELAGGVMGAIGLPDCITSGESAARRGWDSARQAQDARLQTSRG
jgi:oxygen-dependent protoporphyrinogen oxidase